ncbi:SwmB domain-containing protein [Clostridium sp. ZS2-4]|uniref:SwmB domain-containing protein n=1 Tax=Clostridium sp. ZS2-4 TaxID=2987703 RepID=UPI00227AE5E3|nr:SwmB domain-containing protein [Clostridium sp. ZS2-4]MCY6355126.1 SwmB domain-containing protein [Clostridium sp. ZS2-4]
MNNKKNTKTALLSSAAIGTLIATAISTNAYAATDALLTESKTVKGDFSQYNLDQLLLSAVNKSLDLPAGLYDDYMSKDLVAFHDDVKGYVDQAAVMNAAVDAALAGENFKLDKYTENVTADKVMDAPEHVTKLTEDENGNVKPVNPAEEPLKVQSVTTVNKTSIVVKLNKEAKETLSKDFFQVTGATVTSIEQGVTKDVYILNIESLDGKKGTVTVNGISKDYDYSAVVVDKAKVEGVQFVNYREFKVKYSTVVDEATAINPANYYFEIVEGTAGKLGSNPTLGSDNNLSTLPDAVVWFAYTDDTKTTRKNIISETVDGKTVVTINLPESARFDGPNPLKVISENRDSVSVGQDKILNKDVTVQVAVRNVKNADGVRNIDTAVFPMLISDTARPELVSGYKTVTNKEELVPFNPIASTTVEVEAVDDAKDLIINFNEPVYKADSVIMYVDGEVKTANISFQQADGTTSSTYANASRAIIDVKAALGDKFAASNEVHNIKVVGVKDLANNITIPSTIEFNVKFINPAQTEKIAPQILGIQQIADNIIEVEWNREGAKADTDGISILKPDGTVDVDYANIAQTESTKVPSGERKGRFFSTIKFNATDKADEAVEADAVKTLAYDGQDFVNRTIKIENLIADTTKGTQKFEESIRLYKDLQAPVFDKLAINDLSDEPETFQQIKDGNMTKIKLRVVDETPFGVNAAKSSVNAMKADGSAIAGDSDVLNKIRVSYEKDGVVRTKEISTLTGAGLDSDVLTIDLTGNPELLKDGILVEGATYKVEVPEGFFSDSIQVVTPASNTDHEWVDSRRTAIKGFTSLAFTATVTVPGTAEETVSDIVPQTSKSLITVIPQPSVSRDEIQIQFKGAIDPATLKDPSNYTLNGKTLAAWGLSSSDITYVVDGPDVNTANKYARFFAPIGSVTVDGAVEITVEGVANLKGAKMTPVTTTIDLKDNKAPMNIASELEGAKNIVLTFDEPIDLASGATPEDAAKNFVVKVDGQIIAVSKATVTSTRALTLELSQNISSPTAKIEVEIIEDNNGNIFVTDKSEYTNKIVEGTVINVQ